MINSNGKISASVERLGGPPISPIASAYGATVVGGGRDAVNGADRAAAVMERQNQHAPEDKLARYESEYNHAVCAVQIAIENDLGIPTALATALGAWRRLTAEQQRVVDEAAAGGPTGRIASVNVPPGSTVEIGAVGGSARRSIQTLGDFHGFQSCTHGVPVDAACAACVATGHPYVNAIRDEGDNVRQAGVQIPYHNMRARTADGKLRGIMQFRDLSGDADQFPSCDHNLRIGESCLACGFTRDYEVLSPYREKQPLSGAALHRNHCGMNDSEVVVSVYGALRCGACGAHFFTRDELANFDADNQIGEGTKLGDAEQAAKSDLSDS